MKNIKFMKTNERCLHCGEKLNDLKGKYCSIDCECNYKGVKQIEKIQC